MSYCSGFETSEYEIFSARLPSGFDGFKIVQLSDLHGAEFGPDGMALVEKIRTLKPDIIALTGDFVNSESDLPAVKKLAERLAALCPVYFVSGNHEYGSNTAPQVKQIMLEAGIVYLSNEFVRLEKDGGGILLGGVEDPNAYADMLSPEELVRVMNEADSAAYKILLGHRNYWVTEYPELDVDLILCGHAHGGLIRIPGVGGLIGHDRLLFPDYTEGVFRTEKYSMVVSRGLGNSAPVPRIFNPPELVCVTLRPAVAEK